MQYNQDPVGTLTPLPEQNIDTGLGLNRMALIQQGVDSIFDTDQFVPLMELGSLAGRPTRLDERALRILADHSRGMTFLIADGVVPSNEDRGYVLRRLMRRAIAQGHRLGFEGEFLPKYVDVVMATMGAAYPELGRERDAILRWVTAEEQGFGRTLETGLTMLDELLARGAVSGEDAFKLHDTFGFPIDLTVEIAGEREVPVDIADFDARMEEQRLRSSAGAGTQERVGAKQEVIRRLSEEPTEFTGYEHLEERTTVAGVLEQGGRTFVKLASSPFYAQGGGQVVRRGCRRDRGRRRVAPRSTRCCAPATTRPSCWRAAAFPRSCQGRRSSRASIAPPARPRRPTTPPRTCCTPRCARRWARTSARPAPTSGPTSCASTSPTARASRPRRSSRSRIASTAGSWPTTRCARSRRRSRRPRSWGRWRSSARSTATSCGWSRSAAASTRASSAAARTCARRPRSASFASSARDRARPTCAGSRRSPARRP